MHVDQWPYVRDQWFFGAGLGDPRGWLFGSWSGFATTMSYGLVVYYEMKILQTLRMMAKCRSTAQHYDVNRALTALALVPLITAILPIMYYMTGLIFCWDMGYAPILATISLSAASVINPLTTILLIKPYRRTLLNAIFRIFPGTVKMERSSMAYVTDLRRNTRNSVTVNKGSN